MGKRMLINLGAVVLGLVVCGVVIWVKWSGEPHGPSTPARKETVAPKQAAVQAEKEEAPTPTAGPIETPLSKPTAMPQRPVERKPTPIPRTRPTEVWETLVRSLPTPSEGLKDRPVRRKAYVALARSQYKEIQQKVLPQVARLYKRDPEMVAHWVDDPKLLLHQVFGEYDKQRQAYASSLEEPQLRLETLLKEVEARIVEAVFRFDMAVKEAQPSPLEQDAEFAKRLKEIEGILRTS